MKLGELKIQALMLIYPMMSLEYDGQDYEEIIYRLKSNHTYSSYVASSVGAINRAFTFIEEKLLTPVCVATACGEKQGRYVLLDLRDNKEILSVKALYVNNEATYYESISRRLIRAYASERDEIKVAYYKRLARIDHLTSNNTEIDLGGIEEIIPYFIKADLLMGEDRDGSLSARERFFEMIDEFASKSENAYPVTVYSLGGI